MHNVVVFFKMDISRNDTSQYFYVAYRIAFPLMLFDKRLERSFAVLKVPGSRHAVAPKIRAVPSKQSLTSTCTTARNAVPDKNHLELRKSTRSV